MKNSDYFEKTNFRSLIEADGTDRIQDRLNVIDVFLGTEDHITLEEMVRLLRENGYDFEPVFVNQCMNRMVELGETWQVQVAPKNQCFCDRVV